MWTPRWFKVGLILFSLLFLSASAWQMEAWARAGGGGGGGKSSMGSRGSRSMSPPKPYTAPQPSQPSQPRPTPQYAPPASQPSQSGSFMRSFGGGLLGGLAGGLLFRSLFGGGPAHGGTGGGMGCGGIGMFDLLVLGGILYLIYWYMKRKRETATAGGGYQSSSSASEIPYQATHAPAYDMSPPPQQPGDWDLEQGLNYIRQQDPYFDPAKFQDQGMDIFFKIQGAWANRDLSTVRNLLTDEMHRLLQADVDTLKAQKEINRLENIAVRSVDITEAWQESGQDFLTVRIYANLLDYNVNEATGQVVTGSQTEPVKFEEYWTFTRPIGSNPWQLSAIQQAPQ